MTPDQTYKQWDWTEPATLAPGAKCAASNTKPPALAKHRRQDTGFAFVQIGPKTFRYWADGRTRLEQLAYLRSIVGDAA
ncbi:hypothetical protein [Ruegeria sp. HKCCE3926]|uniref:hypothetical protein n=1 Tax=Ruegeria sp. HKCCE3926 TaxID=2794831 RepID=UPI001AE695A2|nr:hypothetical protein [Ruegeria sp. HKCCE3926]